MKNKKTIWLSVFRNFVPTDYENWLEQLALQGWNIDHINQWSSIIMTFHRSEPKKYRYIFDLQVFSKEDYKNTYEQFGWEFVGKMASCFIWRKEYTNKRPESFTSRESLEKRNKQVIYAVSISFIIFLIAFIIIITTFILNSSNLSSDDILQFILGTILSFAFTLYLGCVMKTIYKNRFK
ncbi:MAG: DUF2812 domain-containing protein [Clostridium tyrobutyricum]|jgi:hypothetical protein|uniref:DUF2812 domain-containing protein n=1 Tax=Clostridium tyrobutyricum TaxID=1519 RepID=UPI002432ECAA|nr:DUF2812 domain-containing protein [Clostridium tyrobutyricum]MCH4198725.1 DUF2812 domain-containing protein [Clostridium tyrobutyricum]MCH4260000.1 DUF2812 domain-containing protein [Clostridium tyrobutyricum]MCI1239660.1 DUF2812 domain-containing protein [Clostridium tyrobutyricum]MCI1652385.1 DUF2812 domain-containing protein [Clostridium tyrobutyricum]MCI1938094.1 DUF2812 domain-containing protein [Clostridium tyrobutyricum]